MSLYDFNKLSEKIENTNEATRYRVVDVNIQKIQENTSNFYDADYHIEALEFSIKELGILEPIQIKRDYTIVSGHRRFRAARKAGLLSVPCIFIDDSVEDTEMLRLIESNAYRKKTNKEIKKEIEFLTYYFKEKKKVEPQNPLYKGRINLLIAQKMGTSESDVKRKKKDNNLKPEASKFSEEREFRKLYKLLKKIENNEVSMFSKEMNKLKKLLEENGFN